MFKCQISFDFEQPSMKTENMKLFCNEIKGIIMSADFVRSGRLLNESY